MTLKKTLVTFAFACCISFYSPLPAWQKVTHEKGITVYKREVKNSAVKQLKASMVVKAPINRVLAVVLDFKTYRQWHPNIKKMKHLDKEKVYIAYGLPMPASDRDVVLGKKVILDKGKRTVYLKMKHRRDYRVPEQDGFVRIPRLSAQWAFTPVNQGRATAITFTGLADLGGWVPAWLVNYVAEKRVVGSVDRLRKRVRSEKVNRKLEKEYSFTKQW